MAVRVALTSLTPEQQTHYRKALTFEYKQKNIMRHPRARPPPPKIVHAYTQDPVTNTVLLPMAWTWKHMKQYNSHTLARLDYTATLQPWSDLQRAELQQVMTVLHKRRTVALTLRTGAGKTAVMLFASCELGLLTVVLVHNSKHCKQWASEIEHYTTARYEIVEAKTNGIRRDTQIIICLWTRWEKIPACVRNSVGLLLVDECDQFNNRSGVEAILSIQPLYTIGATATFQCVGTGMDKVATAIFGDLQVSREFDVEFDVDKILTGCTGDEVPSQHTKGCDWNTLKHSLLYDRPARNNTIVNACRVYLQQGHKIMMITTEVRHCKLLHEMLTQAGLDSDYMCEDKRDYTDALGRILIGTAKCCGRGFDQQSACANWCGERTSCMMAVDYVNNDSDRTQWGGRAMRCTTRRPLIVHFVDRNPTIQRQWKNAEKMYTQMGGTIRECELTGTV